MSQDLATYAISQMPHITGPNPLYPKVMTKLTANGFDQTTYAFAKPQLLWAKLGRLSVLGWYRKLKPLIFKKLPLKRLGQISPIGQKQTPVTTGKFIDHMNIMNIGRGQSKGLDHTDRINFQVQPKAIKGLITEFLAVAGQTFEKFAISGSGESAYRHWEAVKNQNCISETAGNVLEQMLLGSPQVGSVADKADPGGQFREVMAVKSFEKFEDFFVGLKAKTFTDYFHCKYFAVSQLRQRASLSKCPLWKICSHKIIDLAKDIYDKIIKIHFIALHGQWNNVIVYLLIPSTRGLF